MQSVNHPVPAADAGLKSGGGLELIVSAYLGKLKSSVLALLAFVAIGSVAFLTYQFTLTSSSTNANMPAAERVEVYVDRMIQLQARGQSGEYSLLVSNLASSAIRDVLITEHLPGDLEYVSSYPQPISQEDPQVIVWRVAEISSAEIIRVTVRLRRDLKPGETIRTKQTITYTTPDGDRETVYRTLVPVIGPAS